MGKWWAGSTELFVIIVCSLLTAPLAVFTSGAVRTIFSLAFILFFPGYTLISSLFPARTRLDGMERFALSFGLSLAIVPLTGLMLNFSPLGAKFEPILWSLLLFILIMAAVAILRRSKLPQGERFAIDFGAFFATVRQDWGKRGSWDKVLTVVLSITIVGTIGATVWVINHPGASERFTEFYILGPDGKADNYPREVVLGTTSSVIVGVVNHEAANATYRIDINIDGQNSTQIAPFTLAAEAKWEQPVSFNATKLGDNQSVQFQLYKTGNATVYRSLHLWLDVQEK